MPDSPPSEGRPSEDRVAEGKISDSEAIHDLFALEEIDRDLYRANFVFSEPYSLYGGQVAAQALRAAGNTVPPEREPHSLHGYFLRRGNASRPTIFQVFRDRDGRSFSARRVVALQGGEVIFNMSASFHVAEDGHDEHVRAAPVTPPPEQCAPFELPRVYSMEGRLTPQPFEGAWPTRMWARCVAELPDDPLLHACVLTYLSDLLTGNAPLLGTENQSGASLDHAVWFHRPVRMDDWVLMDLEPQSTARGRGWYTGALYSADGVLVASIAQEALFRRIRRDGRP